MSLKDAILKHATRSLVERTESSAIFGVTLGVREMTRKQWKEANEWATAATRADLSFREALYAAMFAVATYDPETGAPFMQPEDVAQLANPNTPHGIWDEVLRFGNITYTLSEVSPEALKSGDSAPDAG